MKKISIYFFALLAVFTQVSCEKINPEDGNVVIIEENITAATTWKASNVYVINGGIYVDANLTIEPGTTIKFKSDSWIAFGNAQSTTLTANGTEEKPIIFTSESASPAAGAWRGIWIESNTLSNSSMTYCQVLYAGSNSDNAAITMDAEIIMNNCKIAHVKKNGIECNSGFVSFTGNTIENVGLSAIIIPCEEVHTIGAGNDISCNEGYGISVNNGTMNDNTAVTWGKQTVPYYIDGGIWVDKNLTISAGVTLKFGADGWLEVGNDKIATFTAIGTANEPITFTSSALTPAPGAWSGLFFESNTSPNSRLSHCVIEFGGKDYEEANVILENVDGITIDNCTIRKSKGYGVYLYQSTWTNTSNTFSDNANGDIHIAE